VHTVDRRYNEVVLSGEAWAAALPQLVEAIFYPIGGTVDVREGSAQQARSVHTSFRRHYGLARGAFNPLLTFDVDAALGGYNLERRRRAECGFFSDSTVGAEVGDGPFAVAEA
jgi:hypothetical protein